MRVLLVKLLVIFSLIVQVTACSSSNDEEIGSTDLLDSTEASDADTAVQDHEITDPCDGPECEPAPICSACEKDSDCGAGTCIADVRAGNFCSRPCAFFGDSACDSPYYCRQFGDTAKDFYCYPLSGVCDPNDGLDCASCERNSDCNDPLICVYPENGSQPFCGRPCEGDGTCPYATMDCGHIPNQSEENICLPLIAGIPRPQCGGLPMGFCQPCHENGQCKTGSCFASGTIGKICTKACDSQEDCPTGTACPPAKGVCLPPLAYGCQGFLTCLGVKCPSKQICYRGFCRDAP
jgi:hypothetical protein